MRVTLKIPLGLIRLHAGLWVHPGGDAQPRELFAHPAQCLHRRVGQQAIEQRLLRLGADTPSSDRTA